ncbi:hydantoinase/oxoprolinase family protein [Aurantimonas sp. Leaf443]|uniref:hydantoinase/oxoprolinase family protein n=1 Tax=Aurantimonas sp. Leaf443 TaxID=1736378 RepID=UPI0006F65F2A|nr:hydantoinase/oxoprolinase family protein [Aurantimonas sp. Leaf443]KQT85229.1 S-layer protein [Aurantimonas sp. Leaf443]
MGWDVGGAHLKAALCEGERVIRVWQAATPLWQGLSHLEGALAAILAEAPEVERHGVTMTGELSDIFASRREGVERLAALMAERLGAETAIYAGARGFVRPSDSGVVFAEIASANWHASAAFAAETVEDGLFLDMGSTTTDIVPMRAGTVRAAAIDDHGRLARGELVYQGYTRTALMGVARAVPFAGAEIGVMNEYFATMADVRRLIGRLDEAEDLFPAADGREKSVPASRARLARMIGLDAGDAPDAAWEGLAEAFVEAQLRLVHDAALRVLSREPIPADAPVVTAGAGRAVLSRLASRLDRGVVDMADLFDAPGALRDAIGRAAPAAAIAVLAGR